MKGKEKKEGKGKERRDSEEVRDFGNGTERGVCWSFFPSLSFPLSPSLMALSVWVFFVTSQFLLSYEHGTQKVLRNGRETRSILGSSERESEDDESEIC